MILKSSYYRKLQEVGEGGEGAGAGTPDDLGAGAGTPGEGTPGEGTPGEGTPGEGTPSPSDFRQQLPENLRNDSRLSGFNSVQELAEAAIQQPQKPQVPNPGDYDLPEGVSEDFRQVVHKLGLTQEGVNELMEYANKESQKSSEQLEQANLKELNKLLDNWGDKADYNLQLARRALATFDTHDHQMSKLLKNSGASNNPVIVQFLHNLGKMLEESPYLKDIPDPVKNSREPQTHANTLYPQQTQ